MGKPRATFAAHDVINPCKNGLAQIVQYIHAFMVNVVQAMWDKIKIMGHLVGLFVCL